MIKLGSKVKDKITGLEGTATGRAKYINGCQQLLIEPPVVAGGDYREIWIDEDRLETVKQAKKIKTFHSIRRGGPSSPPPMRSKGR